MKYVTLSILLLAALVGCDRPDTTLSNVQLQFLSRDLSYTPTDTFVGIVTFTNHGSSRVRYAFSSGYQVAVRFYDSCGVERLRYGYFADLAVSYLELEPHGVRTDTFTICLSRLEPQLEPGVYRARASVAYREDIFDETIVEVR